MQNTTRTETRVKNDIGIIDIEGEVTSFSEEVLSKSYEDLSAEGLNKICFNFDQVKYINSAGMAVLISILTQSRKREQTLRCFGLTEHFQKIFDMVGITKYMAHFEDEQRATTEF